MSKAELLEMLNMEACKYELICAGLAYNELFN